MSDDHATTLPRYFVSARHRVRPPSGVDEGWRPYQTYHARIVGRSMTVCGEPALGWPYFWEMPFEPGPPQACRICSRIVLQQAP